MSIETVRVDLLGISFTIQTDESRQYLESVLEFLRAKVADVKATTKIEDPLKISILASIYLVDELMRAKVDGTVRSELSVNGDNEIYAIAERLIARIDNSLRADTPSAPLEEAGTTGDKP